MKSDFFYGGQAVIDGVMMRGQRHYALALRRPDGGISLVTHPLDSLYTGKARRLPLVRGIILLVETLVLGMRALLYSAKASLGEEEEMPRGAMGGAVLAAVLFAAGLFFALPYFLSRLLAGAQSHSLMFNLVESGVRLGIFLLYLKLIGMWSQIARVFAYHGAEHKVVNAYEAGVPLEVVAVQRFATAHLRCGTSFLLMVMVMAIPVFALIGSPSPWLALPLRLALLPLIAALSYELIRFGARHPHHPLVRLYLVPGMWLQGLTTRSPDGGQIEVALEAMKGVLTAEGQATQ